MSKVLNGHGGSEEIHDPHHELAEKILNDFLKFWMEKRDSESGDEVMFTKLSVVALTQLSAMLAVDVGFMKDNFIKTCEIQFDESYKRAPKFGE